MIEPLSPLLSWLLIASLFLFAGAVAHAARCRECDDLKDLRRHDDARAAVRRTGQATRPPARARTCPADWETEGWA